MKIVLLTLSGDAARAHETLKSRYPDATINSISREELEKVGSAQRIRMLRAMRPEIFAVATERLVWQRGQDQFLLLGALAGARRTIIFDAHKGWREESKGRALAYAPARVAREAAMSSAAMRRAAKELRALEAAVTRDEHRQVAPAEGASHPQMIYLRASPGPGTQAGGAASHINGFVNAALQLGTRVSLITQRRDCRARSRKSSDENNLARTVGSSRAAFDIYNNLHFTERAVSEIQNEPPDFIYQRYARFSWAGVAAALRTKRPLFLEYNGSEVWVGRHWDRVDKLDLLARYERLNLNAAARIFVVSEVERQNLLKAGIEPEKIIVNPNGVDVDRFKPGIGGDAARRELGSNAG